MHGWNDVDPKRYNSKILPVVIIILSIFIMYFMTYEPEGTDFPRLEGQEHTLRDRD